VDNASTSNRRAFLISLVLFFGTLALYSPVLWFDFVIYDDGDYILENPRVLQGLTWSNVGWSFTTTLVHNWHPLTMLSHMLDITLFGLNAGGHHLTSVVFHAINSVMLFIVLRQATSKVWNSAIVAALFAWHPLHVESVAWVSERKDVLSTLFLLLTCWAYNKYALARITRRTSGGQQLSAGKPSMQRKWYLIALLFFAAGLMSKPMLVTLPFALLLLDYWPLRRFSETNGSVYRFLRQNRDIFIEKLPFLILTVATCAVTIYAQDQAMKPSDQFPLIGRIQNAFVSYGKYLWHAVYPVKLSVFYPHPRIWPTGSVALAAGLLALVSVTCLILRKRFPFLTTGWFWYLGTLVPVIGLVQVGGASMADRYTYIPLIGIFIMAIWGLSELVALKCRRGLQIPITCVTILILFCMSILTARQVTHWQDSESLFLHTAAVTEENEVAYFNLGMTYFKEGRLQEANDYFQRVLREFPEEPDTHRMIGQILCKLGKTAEGANHLRIAETAYHARLVADPLDYRASRNAALTHVALGLAFATERLYSEALQSFRTAIEIDPEQSVPYNEAAWILATAKDSSIRNGSEAIRLAEKACELTQWQRVAFVGTLDTAYAEAGRFNDAIATAEKVMRLGEEKRQGYLAELARQRMELYKQGKPFRQ
jgi:tetratricopeptide (TPR) repeat protein